MSDSTLQLPSRQRNSFTSVTRHADVRCLTHLHHIQQKIFFRYGVLVSQHWKVVICLGTIFCLLPCLGLKELKFENKFEQSWASEDSETVEGRSYEEKILKQTGTSYRPRVQSLLQTSNVGSVLTPEALLAHSRVLQRAASLEVTLPELTDKVFTQHSLCLRSALPDSQDSLLSSFMSNMSPCDIITPLHCFWEGSKILGPRSGTKLPTLFNVPLTRHLDNNIYWYNMDPIKLLEEYKSIMQRYSSMNLDSYEKLFETYGIGHGYMNRPCLDIEDLYCPNRTHRARNLPATLSAGCSGFAEKVMRIPVSLIVGGKVHDPVSGHLVSANSLQTQIFLRSAEDLLKEYRNNQPYYDWTLSKVNDILSKWHAAFKQMVQEENARQSGYTFSSFTDEDLDLQLRQTLVEVQWRYYCLCAGAIILLFCVFLADYNSPVHSHVWTGFLLLILLLASLLSGMGISAVLGFSHNLFSFKIIPLVIFAFGSCIIIILSSSFHRLCLLHVQCNELKLCVPRFMQQEGPNLLFSLILLMSMSGLLAAFPVPALRAAAAHALAQSLMLLLLLFVLMPAVLAADAARRAAVRVDLGLCKVRSPQEPACDQLHRSLLVRLERKWMQSVWTSRSYQFSSILVLVLLLSAGIYSFCRLISDPDYCPMDIIPDNSQELNYLKNHVALFQTSPIHVFTKSGFDYPNSQRILRKFFKTLFKLPNLKEMSTNIIWLDQFRAWLLDLQLAYNDDVKAGLLNHRGSFVLPGTRSHLAFNYTANVSDKALLAAHLLVQTCTPHFGQLDFKRLEHAKLVHPTTGLIDAGCFYIYLTAWYSLSSLSYDTANVVLLPVPERYHIIVRENLPNAIPPSRPIIFAQSLFMIKGVNSTATILHTRAKLRNISRQFNEQGIKNSIGGTIFDFYSSEWINKERLGVILCVAFFLCGIVSVILTGQLAVSTLMFVFLLVNTGASFLLMILFGVSLNMLTLTYIIAQLPLMHFLNYSLLIKFIRSSSPPESEGPPLLSSVYTTSHLDPSPSEASTRAPVRIPAFCLHVKHALCALLPLVFALVPIMSLQCSLFTTLFVVLLPLSLLAALVAGFLCLPAALHLLPFSPPDQLSLTLPVPKATPETLTSLEEPARRSRPPKLSLSDEAVFMTAGRRLHPIDEESRESSPMATPQAFTQIGSGSRLVTATLRLDLQGSSMV